MSVITTTRNASLSDLRDLLVDQHARKIDVVVPAQQIRLEDGALRVRGVEPVIEDDGVTDPNGLYQPTEVFDEGLSEKVRIPLGYVRRMRQERPDLLDQNVNGWLHGRKPKVTRNPAWQTAGAYDRAGIPEFVTHREAVPGDDRSFLVRLFRGDGDEQGVARALLSSSYRVMDNLDALVAALDGIRQAGVNVEVAGADLTDRRMYVRIVAPEVQALAPTLLGRYRSPFTGETGADNPTMFAGFVLSNSETGDGAFSIVPRLVVQVCTNGMTITRDAMRAVHLGGRMDDGVIRWSEDTQRKQAALISAKARDAVSTFLDVDYMQRVVESLQDAAERPIKDVEDVKVVAKRLAFDQETTDRVFEMFVRGSDMTAGGVMHAVTAAARETPDADKASALEDAALKALETAAAL